MTLRIVTPVPEKSGSSAPIIRFMEILFQLFGDGDIRKTDFILFNCLT